MLIVKNIGKIGLQNNGNTCYLNSCLQLLTHSGFFTLELYNFYKKNKNKDLKQIEKYLLELVLNKWFSNNVIYNPIKIHKEVSKNNDMFNPIYCQQHDSSEFLIFVLNELNIKLQKIFNSTFVSVLKCKNCKNIRKTNENFLIWSVDVYDHINSSIKSFFKSEEVEDIFCDTCKQKTDCYKKYEYGDISNNLIIHLKRFKVVNNRYIKNKKVLCASSIHEKEEIICGFFYKNLKKKYKNLLTVIIPRHINRVGNIKNDLEKSGLTVQIHKKEKKIQEGIDIYLVSSYGETAIFYSEIKNIFIGGSLIKHGGPNPLEAIRFGCRVINGPFVSNFKEIYDFLIKERISTQIKSLKNLSKLMDKLFSISLKTNIVQNKIRIIGDRILEQTYNEIKKT